MVKVREDMTGWIMSEHGVSDSRLTVIEQVEDHVYADKQNKEHHYAQWLCECNCDLHTRFIAVGEKIKSGKIKSCGCRQKELLIQRNKINHGNTYDLSGEYGIGYTSNTNKEFYFDLEDYNKIKDYCWCESHVKSGYIVISAQEPGTNKTIKMHQLIYGETCDHKDRNPLNNRKNNLRPATYSQQNMNRGIAKNNTSGFIGVYWIKNNKKWQASININHKKIHLGYFNDKNEAIKTRLKAEFQYYGEFAPQRHLFEVYGITTIQN